MKDRIIADLLRVSLEDIKPHNTMDCVYEVDDFNTKKLVLILDEDQIRQLKDYLIDNSLDFLKNKKITVFPGTSMVGYKVDIFNSVDEERYRRIIEKEIENSEQLSLTAAANSVFPIEEDYMKEQVIQRTLPNIKRRKVWGDMQVISPYLVFTARNN
jgi:hypothetical protein